HIDISVKESRLHSVSITGSVKSPQIYPVLGRTKLLAVLSQAGGLAEGAGSVVKIARGPLANNILSKTSAAPSGGNSEASSPTITINLNELFAGADPNLNVDIYPGDWITVPPAGVVYVLGAVNRAGGFPLTTSREHMTVLQALALAEDIKGTAKRDHAMIIRRDAALPNGRQEIAVNLKTIMAGKSPDIPLQVNDILFVPESSGKKVLHRGAEAIIQAATGAAIYRP
ncbi:MAG TPA: SLBB domain-containing protein, partial [Terriglobales bacterium]